MKKKSNVAFKTLVSAILISSLALSNLPFGGEIQKAEASAQEWDFGYTGNVQSWTVPHTGNYQLETWGAQGGDAGYYSFSDATGKGGKGGYSKGEIHLDKGEVIYLYVGGQGENSVGSYVSSSTFTVSGGWNGGGTGQQYGMTGGGGATDIRTITGHWSNSTSLQSRLIVAGGGGGAGNSGSYTQLSHGGAGGGTVGQTMPSNTQFSGRTAGSGGSQTSGNALGAGADTSGDNLRGGGGGGYYGGGVGGNSTGGGGGSGYIAGVQNGQTIAGNLQVPTTNGGTQTGHSGHGYAKITSLNSPPVVNVSSPANNVQLNPGVTVNLTGTINDPDNRGTMYVKYAIDNGTPVQFASLTASSSNRNFNTNVLIPSNLSIGNHTLSVWGEDNEGGVGDKRVLIFTVRDIINPTLSLSLNTASWTKDSIVIQANASDNQAIKQIKLPNGNYINGSTATYTVTDNGTYTFEAEDMSGNSIVQTINVDNKDSVLPTFSSARVENVTKTGYDVVVTGVSDNASGVNRVMFPTWTELNGQDDLAPSWSTNNNVKGINEGNGVWRFHVDQSAHNNEYGEYITHVYVIDNAGNQKAIGVRAFLDGEAPTLNVLPSSNEWTSGTVSLQVTASDSGTGVKRIQLPSGNWTSESSATFIVSANGSYTFKAEDHIGNTSTKTVSVSNIDKSKPTISHALNKNELATGEIVITVNGADSQSGVSAIVDVENMQNGLTGEYRKHTIPAGSTPPTNMGSTVFERVDSSINFVWASGSPDPRLSAEGYNVTWTGYIKSPVSGDVTFETNTDDGVRLKLGDNLLIDKWVQQSPTKYTKTINLLKDEWYPITMDYYENGGGSTAELRWSHEGTDGFEIVPNSVLYTGGKTEGSRLIKNVSRNGEFVFFAEDNVGNIKEHQVTIANLTYKPELTVAPNHEEDFVALDWTIEDVWQKYSYMIYKKKSTESEYQTIPAKEKVKMLNIYPNVGAPVTFTNWKGEVFTLPQSAQAKMWLEKPNNEHEKGYGKGLIDTDVVSLTEFNANPNKYLKNLDGTWKYDVVYTGSWDCYGYCSAQGDFSVNSADALKGFIQSGRGYLTGHDTIWSGHPNMNTLREFGKIQLGVGIDMSDSKTTGSTEIVIDRKGLLTNYPWDIGNPGTVLTIPYTHTSQQFANGDVWLSFNTPDFSGSTGALGNFYLTTWSNMAMIQLGHSNGQATPDEQKVLANTIFYLAQMTSENSWDDNSSQDVNAPNQPTIQNVIADGINNKVKIDFMEVVDNGTTYNYYVEATGDKNHAKTNSDIESATVLSGLKGYSYVIDNNPTTIPDSVVDTTDTNLTINKELTSNFYVHVVAIDNVGNVSDVAHYHYEDNGAPLLNVDASPTSWTKGTVLLTATATDNETAVRRIQLPDKSWVSGEVANYTVQNNGTYVFVAEDFVGNKTTKAITVTNVDKTPPNIPIISNNEEWVKADYMNVSIQAGTDSASGVKRVEYRLEGATIQYWTTYTGTFTIRNEGETKVLARTIDNVGHASAEATSFVRLDRTAPYNMGITIKLKP